MPISDSKNGACIGVLAKVDGNFDSESLKALDIVQTSRVADIVVMRVPLDRLGELESVAGIVTYSVSHRAAPMMDNTRFDTHTDSVQAGVGVPMPFTGDGVIIGITDWGFDYTHPNINKRTKQRILAAWDQFRTKGPAPEGFDYGTEISGYDTLRAYQGDTSNLYGYGTHGTHVAGICGGNGTGGHAVGQAPDALFLLGSWYLDEAHWLDQVSWMKSVADREGKRLVINSSWGMYTFSTLDGTSLLSQAINAYSDMGIVFVTSAGNNGDSRYHLRHTFGNDDTLSSVASYLSSGVGQALIYWGEPQGEENAGQFSAGFAFVDNNDYSNIAYSPMFSTNSGTDYLESFILVGDDTVHFDIMTESANPLDNRPHILLNVDKMPGYRLIMRCTADSGTMVNIWNVGNVENHAGNTGCDFTATALPDILTPGDFKYGIGEPACAEKTISVAAHEADRRSGQSVNTGNIAYFSSYGPTLDGKQKPEISAPGYGVVSSISAWCDGLSEYSAYYEVMNGGHKYIWSSMSGTSMSSPAVSGIVALMLQANPNLSVDQIREIIFTTARNDDKTGPLHDNDSISERWGYGKIDALRAVNAAYDRLSVEQAATIRPNLIVYPNPATSQITVRTGSNKPLRVEILSALGQRIMTATATNETAIDISNLTGGVYFVRVHDNAGVRTAKFVKTSF